MPSSGRGSTRSPKRWRSRTLLDRQGGTLSGGQKRRVHTAIALLHRPPLLLLDEATTGADVETRGRVLELVRGLAAGGSAVLYSTHYLQEVEDLRATVVLLDGGRVIARGGADELIAAHAAPVVELAFEGEVPTLAVDGSAIVDGSRVRLPTTDPATTLATVVPGLPPALTARLREGRSCQSPPPVFLTILRTQRVDRSRKKGRGYVSQLTAPRRSGSPPSRAGRWGRTWRRSRSTRCQGQRPNHVALNRRPAEQPSKPHQRAIPRPNTTSTTPWMSNRARATASLPAISRLSAAILGPSRRMANALGSSWGGSGSGAPHAASRLRSAASPTATAFVPGLRFTRQR